MDFKKSETCLTEEANDNLRLILHGIIEKERQKQKCNAKLAETLEMKHFLEDDGSFAGDFFISVQLIFLRSLESLPRTKK